MRRLNQWFTQNESGPSTLTNASCLWPQTAIGPFFQKLNRRQQDSNGRYPSYRRYQLRRTFFMLQSTPAHKSLWLLFARSKVPTVKALADIFALNLNAFAIESNRIWLNLSYWVSLQISIFQRHAASNAKKKYKVLLIKLNLKHTYAQPQKIPHPPPS